MSRGLSLFFRGFAILLGMFQALLSVLLMGTVPVSGSLLPLETMTHRIHVSPPALRVSVDGRLSASGIVIMDAQSGQQLYGRAVDVPRPMASLTKLMTALIIVEHHTLTEVVRIPVGIPASETSVALPAGEQFTVGDVLSAMLIPSANDAAVALAIFHSGSTEAFVKEMNARAVALGLQGTSFENPIGFDGPEQLSTPQDMAWLTMAALRYPSIQRRLGMRGTTIVSMQGTEIPLSHTHALLHEKGSVVAGKTGTTTGANQCLVSVVDEGNHRYIVVLLDSLQRYADMQSILRTLDRSTVDHQSVSLHSLPPAIQRP